jgi:hypothetical protein
VVAAPADAQVLDNQRLTQFIFFKKTFAPKLFTISYLYYLAIKSVRFAIYLLAISIRFDIL